MIRLNTNQKIEILLNGAVTTNELRFETSYSDVSTTTGAQTGYGESDGVTSGATPVTMVDAPSAGNSRVISNLNIYNKDTVDAVVTLQKDNAATDREIMVVTMSSGDRFEYEQGGGSVVIDSNGRRKMVMSYPSMTSAQFAGILSDETGSAGGGVVVFNNGPTLIAPILGTPASGTLTNCTGLPAASVVAGTFGAGTYSFSGSTITTAAITTLSTVTNFSSGLKLAGGDTLDAYDYGATFTPVVADASSGGNTGGGSLIGYYIKTGRGLQLTVNLSNITTVGMTAGNDFYIRSLPFAGIAAAVQVGNVVADTVTFTGQISVAIVGSTTVFRLIETASASATDYIMVSEISTGVSDIYATFDWEMGS